jgi:hypothetical protein
VAPSLLPSVCGRLRTHDHSCARYAALDVQHYGDGIADSDPVWDLHASEVVVVAHALETQQTAALLGRSNLDCCCRLAIPAQKYLKPFQNTNLTRPKALANCFHQRLYLPSPTPGSGL